MVKRSHRAVKGRAYRLGLLATGIPDWDEEQMKWLKGKAQGVHRPSWVKIAAEFEAQFGFSRNHPAIRGQWLRMVAREKA
jgi:hypothetical protein